MPPAAASRCYQIRLLRPGVGIVVSPLIALMQDQVDALLQAGVRAAFLDPGRWTGRRCRRLNGSCFPATWICSTSPRAAGQRTQRRVCSIAFVSRSALALFHRRGALRRSGDTIRPEYQLSALHELFPDIPRIALTATADEATRGEIITRLGFGEARASSFQLRPPEHPLHGGGKGQPAPPGAELVFSPTGAKPASSIARPGRRSMKPPNG